MQAVPTHPLQVCQHTIHQHINVEDDLSLIKSSKCLVLPNCGSLEGAHHHLVFQPGPSRPISASICRLPSPFIRAILLFPYILLPTPLPVIYFIYILLFLFRHLPSSLLCFSLLLPLALPFKNRLLDNHCIPNTFLYFPHSF